MMLCGECSRTALATDTARVAPFKAATAPYRLPARETHAKVKV